MSLKSRLMCMGLGAAIVACVGATNAAAPDQIQARPDGEILALTLHAALPTYETLDEFARRYFQKSEYEEARSQTSLDVFDLRYSSGGVEVPGILIRPKELGNRQWPAVVYNRGGTGDFGRLDDVAIVEMLLLARSGFVMIASDYRFHGPTARQDQWGGADLDDVLNVVQAVRALPYVDPGRVFMLGQSRGGTMTYLALKREAPIRAAAVTSGVSDLEALGRYRPEFVTGDDTYEGWAKVWPEYATRSTEHYRERSAVHWAERIRVPILIVASRTDRLVPADQALRMAQALQAAGARYALHIYAEDGHGLPLNRADRIRRITEWFLQAP